MRVIIFLLCTLFFSSQVLAETFLIDERKTDIYFANGVGAVSKTNSFRQGKVPSFHLSRGGTHIATIKETHGQKPL